VLNFAKLFFFILFITFLSPTITLAEEEEDEEPFKFDVESFLEKVDKTEDEAEDTELDKYSAKELTEQANYILDNSISRSFILARSKLLKAIEKDPKYFQAHVSLANYYVAYVNHFRLAYKYYKQADHLFREKNGYPPYTTFTNQDSHSSLLAIGHQVFLNLDDYHKSLSFLNDYEKYGYKSDWLASSKSWVLMKLGRVKEAIKIMQSSLDSTENRGRSLNMLGILFSVDDQPEEAIKIFEQAVKWEKLLGPYGHAATPLNNAGEVYRERFRDEKAEDYWLRAKQLRDGCEHVLPSLNLAIYYMDQHRIDSAAESLDTFESCKQQYSELNDEEHSSLVNLVRGRIALSRGQLQESAVFIEQAMEKQQWFGKIGSNVEDLELAAKVSRFELIEVINNRLKFRLSESYAELLELTRQRVNNFFLKFWLGRNIRFLALELANFEDLKIRHTDSFLEYPKIGAILKTFPPNSALKRIAAEESKDNRQEAKNYYNLYRSEVLIAAGRKSEAEKILKGVVSSVKRLGREELDLGLLLRTNYLLATLYEVGTKEYCESAIFIFNSSPFMLRNLGLILPVKLTNIDESAKKLFYKAGFRQNTSPYDNLEIISYYNKKNYKLIFKNQGVIFKTSKSKNLRKAINDLADKIFSS
jgi:Tfp pilus assembly protein PilF